MKISGYDISIVKLIIGGIITFILAQIIGYLIAGDYDYLAYWYTILRWLFSIIFIILVVRGKFGIIKKIEKRNSIKS